MVIHVQFTTIQIQLTNNVKTIHVVSTRIPVGLSAGLL